MSEYYGFSKGGNCKIEDNSVDTKNEYQTEDRRKRSENPQNDSWTPIIYPLTKKSLDILVSIYGKFFADKRTGFSSKIIKLKEWDVIKERNSSVDGNLINQINDSITDFLNIRNILPSLERDFGSLVNGGESIEAISKFIVESFSSDSSQIELTIQTEPVELSSDRLYVTAMVANELIMNILHDANKNKDNFELEVRFEKREERIVLRIKDSRIDLTRDDLEIDNTQRLRMARQLVENQLDGTFSFSMKEGEVSPSWVASFPSHRKLKPDNNSESLDEVGLEIDGSDNLIAAGQSKS